MFFSRIPRVSRFNARAFAFQQCFGTARARRMTFGVALTLAGVIGSIALWPARPVEQRAEDRKVAWEAFAPKRVIAARTRAKVVAPPKPVDPPAIVVRTVTPARNQPAAPARAADPLGPLYVDEVNGFSIRFPARWSLRATADTPWVLDCGDPDRGLISIGFSSSTRAPARQVSAAHSETTLHARGSAVISGRKAIWNKITGPLNAARPERVTRITYVLPVAKNRLLEVRVAATPSAFEEIIPLMKQSVATLRLKRPVNRDVVAVTD